jgi:hypothetical protein
MRLPSFLHLFAFISGTVELRILILGREKGYTDYVRVPVISVLFRKILRKHLKKLFTATFHYVTPVRF